MRGADRVGLRFFEILALVVAAHGHCKAESNDQTKKRQRRGSDEVKIFPLFLLEGPHFLANRVPGIRRKPLRDESNRQNEEWGDKGVHPTASPVLRRRRRRDW